MRITICLPHGRFSPSRFGSWDDPMEEGVSMGEQPPPGSAESRVQDPKAQPGNTQAQTTPEVTT